MAKIENADRSFTSERWALVLFDAEQKKAMDFSIALSQLMPVTYPPRPMLTEA
jgi:hypothetical protein